MNVCHRRDKVKERSDHSKYGFDLDWNDCWAMRRPVQQPQMMASQETTVSPLPSNSANYLQLHLALQPQYLHFSFCPEPSADSTSRWRYCWYQDKIAAFSREQYAAEHCSHVSREEKVSETTYLPNTNISRYVENRAGGNLRGRPLPFFSSATDRSLEACFAFTVGTTNLYDNGGATIVSFVVSNKYDNSIDYA